MKLKLSPEDAHILLHEIKTFTFWKIATHYEKEITKAVLKLFALKVMKKLITPTKPTGKPITISFELDQQTILALEYVTSKMTPEHEYNQVIIWNIHSQLHQHLVNIS